MLQKSIATLWANWLSWMKKKEYYFVFFHQSLWKDKEQYKSDIFLLPLLFIRYTNMIHNRHENRTTLKCADDLLLLVQLQDNETSHGLSLITVLNITIFS